MGIENLKSRVITALTDNYDSRAAYLGRVTQRETITVYTEDGTPIQTEVDVYITLETVFKILALALKKIGL